MTNENTENHSIPVRLTDILHFKSLSVSFFGWNPRRIHDSPVQRGPGWI